MEKLRDWLADDREGFCRASLEVLRSEQDSRGLRGVLGLLMGAGLIEDALCDDTLDLREKAKIARLAFEMQPQLENSLARSVAAAADCQEPATVAHAVRLMSVLAEVSDGSRVLTSLARLRRSENPELRSKAVLLMARANRGINWVQAHLSDPDPNIRANAIEAISGIDSLQSRELLEAGTRDIDSRVAGRALLGLYRLGESTILTQAMNMSRHDSPDFRDTAAWLMGETGDERLRAPLAQLMRDPVAAVRSRAFKSLGRIKEQCAAAQAQPAMRCRVAARFIPGAPTAQPNVAISVTSPDGSTPIRLLPIHFQLWADGSPILNYQVSEHPMPEPMSVVFVFPRSAVSWDGPWIGAALECLNWKRTADLWSCVWAAQSAHAEDGTGYEPLLFAASAQKLTLALKSAASREECAGLWRSMLRAIEGEAKVERGKRHVVVFVSETIEGPPGDDLASALRRHQSVQVISAAPNPELEMLCHNSGTRLIQVETPDEARLAIEQAYLSLLARYEISYEAPQAVRRLEIRIRAPEAIGEATLPALPLPTD